MSGNVEDIKKKSGKLRGTLLESLAEPLTGALAEDDTQLSKFHGIYQQDDRDIRNERMRQRLEPAYSFMIRARVPGGLCTPAQWLNMDKIAGRYANGSIRLTTRQAFQLHGVIKRDLKTTVAAINEQMMDTLAACGDVNRNVMAPTLFELTEVHLQVQRHARELSDHLTPATRAYHEIWLDGEKLEGTEPEPIYGETYLPRKFKSGFVIPPQNDIDVYTQDLGFIAIVEGDQLLGYNVIVGGGMGMSHGEPTTYPRLGSLIGFCGADDFLAIGEAVVTTQRDHGDRSNRKHARLKYTIDDHGVDWFRGEVEARSGVCLEAPRPFRFTTNGDVYGWQRDDRGLWHYTMFIENGRVNDTAERALLSALREVALLQVGEFRLTPNQNISVSALTDSQKADVERVLQAHGARNQNHASALRQHSMACVGFPTCGLAMAESERYLPDLVTQIEALLHDSGVAEEAITVRMTGCPNGCARPYVAEIGLVGKAPGRYNLYLGAGFAGERLNSLYRENIDELEILAALKPLVERYAGEREAAERFGDFLVRIGEVRHVAEGREFHGATA